MKIFIYVSFEYLATEEQDTQFPKKRYEYGSVPQAHEERHGYFGVCLMFTGRGRHSPIHS